MARKGKGKHRLDKFYRLAKEQGYRSRASFKLLQLNRKFQFLNNCAAVLDLCAAPGGWLQVAAKHVPIGSMVLGVDLEPIKPVRGAKTFVADITTDKCRSLIKKEAGERQFDVVLHDGAPNVGGAWHSEALSQTMLVVDALRLATEFLTPKGWFISKVFRSNDYNALLYACKQLFDKVDATKPPASRGTSAETFIVCQGYKAPGKIDPRLLNPKFLFQEMTTAGHSGGPDVLQKQTGRKPKRHRDGYADGASTTYVRKSAVAFLLSEEPIELLGQCTQFVFDGADATKGAEEAPEASRLAEALSQDPLTTNEIKDFCSDLPVLSRKDFKALLKWRLTMRRRLDVQKRDSNDDEKEDVEEEEDMESKMLKEMEAIRERMEHRKRKERKRRQEQKRKAKIKLAKIVEASGERIEDGSELFSLSGLKTAKDVARVNDAPAPDVGDMLLLEKDSEAEGDDDIVDDSEDEEDQRKMELLQEEYLEESYNRYMAEKGSGSSYKKRKRLDGSGELEGHQDSDGDDLEYDYPDSDELPGEERIEGGGLLVDLDESQIGVPKTAAALSAQWFSQDVFKGFDLGGIGVESTNGDIEAAKGDDSDADLESMEVMEDSDDAEDVINYLVKESADPALSKLKEKDGSGSDSDYEAMKKAKAETRQDDGDFEVVPVKDKESGTDTEDEFRMLDVEGKAEVLALAKRFLHRKDKENIIDAAYNRYAFHDENPIPRWLKEDEKQHMRPVAPVTRADVEEQKAVIRALNSRPIKKVAEAKARKRKRLAQRLTSARKRAEGILAHEDTSMSCRMREVAKVYAKAQSEDKKWKQGKKKKSTRRTSKRKGPPLDARLRADKRMRGSGRNMKNARNLAQTKQQAQVARKEKRKKKAAKRNL